MRGVLGLTAVLLTAAAAATGCGTMAGSTTPGAASAPPSVPVELKSTCDALGQVYGERMAPFAESLTTLVGRRTPDAQKRAQDSLAAFATAVDDATRASGDAALRADGKKTAEKLRAKSGDPKFFAAIKTEKDVTTTLGPTLKEWLTPVTRHCS
ncbi:hypothetical protein [Paractinoplanes atraurantiacus]|uniref:Uncharacterized protein n=1 Tax=Paractinoplanes atraurantiacus TaxID=1036182 RepID=A0A285J3H5_9ACTN|nr:hypothetical protein [Actinoplanes atraurantiacus]SNY54869.1 hypothetical protein SAMN05421748_115178 [Actinoplanes atraurantiacus]